MVLVSIHPFAFRKIFLLAAAILGLSSAFCFGDSVFMASHYEPSREHGRRALLAIHSENFQSIAIRPALQLLDVKNSARRGAVAPGVAAVFEEEGNQVFAVSIETRSCGMPVCVWSRGGLMFAWAPPSGAGVYSC